MVPLRGWGPKGGRLKGFAPHGHWRTLTFFGALRADALAAPYVFAGPINGACLRAYRAAARPDAAGGRHRHPGQSRQPQGRRRPPPDQGRRRQALVPAALLARPQSDRAGFRQDQALEAHRAKADRREYMSAHRPPRRHDHARQMRKLPRQRRLRFNQNMKRSSRLAFCKDLRQRDLRQRGPEQCRSYHRNQSTDSVLDRGCRSNNAG